MERKETMDFLSPAYKNILIIGLLFVLGLCVVYIGRLRRLLAREQYRRLNPRLNLQLINNTEQGEPGLYLINESDFVVKGATIEDMPLTLTDFGVKQNLILRFEPIGLLTPKEKIPLTYKAFDQDNRFLPHISQNLTAHLLNALFTTRIRYTQADGRILVATFCKQREKFYCEKVELIS